MEDDGDAHTLGLLIDMRSLTDEIAAANEHVTARLNELVRQMRNPNVHGLDKELTFRVFQLQVTDQEYPETLRTISMNGNASVARGAFFAAGKAYPNYRWILKWGMMVLERYDPPKENKSE